MPINGKRSFRDIEPDVKNISNSLAAAFTNAKWGTGNRLWREHALRLTPVKTGYMRSRWRVKQKSRQTISVGNDTRYLPFVNQRGRHAGFFDRIASFALPIFREESGKIKIVKIGKGIAVRYRSAEAIAAARTPYPRPVPQPPHYSRVPITRGRLITIRID